MFGRTRCSEESMLPGAIMISKRHYIWSHPVFSLLRSFPPRVNHDHLGSRHAKSVFRGKIAISR